MKILFLKSGSIPDPLISWLKDDKDNKVTVFEKNISKQQIISINPDIVISYNYRFLIKKDVIKLLPKKIINLHIAYLPWNRGAHPNLWSFLKNTPKGVTIHLIDKGIDTGDILLQKDLKFDNSRESLNSSYMKLHRVIQDLFKKNWDKMKEFKIKPKVQKTGGSIHTVGDFDKIQKIIPKDWNITINKLLIKYKSLKNAN